MRAPDEWLTSSCAILKTVTADELVRLWWIPLAVAIVAGLAVASVKAAFMKPVRERLWKPIGRALRRPFTLRLITTDRLKVLDENNELLQAAVGEAKQTGIAEGRAEALKEVEAERAVPLAKPNWIVSMIHGVYRLANTQGGVSVTDVSLSAPVDKFILDGQTQWPGNFDQATQFRGSPTHTGREAGVPFTVRYRDARGDWHDLPAFLDRELPQGVYY